MFQYGVAVTVLFAPSTPTKTNEVVGHVMLVELVFSIKRYFAERNR